MFKHFGSNKKGDSIAFVMMEENLSFVEAVKQLLGARYTPLRDAVSHTVHALPEKKDLILPDKAANYKRAYWYLVAVRGIDASIVSALMNEKKVYQDTRGNCVFIGYDEQGKPRHCAKRGTGPNAKEQYKGDHGGSDKSYPFHIVGRSNKVYAFESAIDCMSHASIAMSFGTDWRQDHRISQGCLADNALQRFLELHDIKEICFAYDNDVDGKKR